MVTERMVQEKLKTSELEMKDILEWEESEIIIEETTQREMSFAELMNPEFVAQFKGCWRW